MESVGVGVGMGRSFMNVRWWGNWEYQIDEKKIKLLREFHTDPHALWYDTREIVSCGSLVAADPV